jgi:hypothetical protein
VNSILVILTTISLLVILVTETSVKVYNNQYNNIAITDYEDYGCLNDPHEPGSDGDGVNIEYLNSVFDTLHEGDLNEEH